MNDVAERWGPPERCVTPDLIAATDLLVNHVKTDRISAVLNRRAPGLGSVSLIELAATGDTTSVLTAVRSMFDFGWKATSFGRASTWSGIDFRHPQLDGVATGPRSNALSSTVGVANTAGTGQIRKA